MESIAREREKYPIVCSEEEAATPRWNCATGDLPVFEAFLEGFEEPPEPSVVLAWVDSEGLFCHDLAAERRRYVYVSINGPMWPQASVEAAVELYWAAHAGLESARGALEILPDRLGFNGGEFHVEPRDEVAVERWSVSVADGAVRGRALNYSEWLWARDVVVTATDAHGAQGRWRFALAVQPGEWFPFEIEGWTGSDDPAEISFDVSADLSSRIDLTRALDFTMAGLVDTRETYSVFRRPQEMVRGEIPEGDFFYWEQYIYRRDPWSHPRLAEDALNQTIENLVAYGVAFGESGTLRDVFKMTPTAEDFPTGEWVEMRTIPMELPSGQLADGALFTIIGTGPPAMWVGGALPPTDETDAQ